MGSTVLHLNVVKFCSKNLDQYILKWPCYVNHWILWRWGLIALDKHVKALFCTGSNPTDSELWSNFFQSFIWFSFSKKVICSFLLVVIKEKNNILSRYVNLVNMIATAGIRTHAKNVCRGLSSALTRCATKTSYKYGWNKFQMYLIPHEFRFKKKKSKRKKTER